MPSVHLDWDATLAKMLAGSIDMTQLMKLNDT